MPGWLSAILIVLGTTAAMEVIANLLHRYVMHGPGWFLHKSHHAPRTGLLELNDVYSGFFAGLSIILIYVGIRGTPTALWIGVGLFVYGLLYSLAHDGLVHRRWPLTYVPRKGYFKRLIQAHRLHHAVKTRENCVSFGFLYALPPTVLKAKLREMHGGGVVTADDVLAREQEAQGR